MKRTRPPAPTRSQPPSVVSLPAGARICVPVDAILQPPLRTMDGVSRGDARAIAPKTLLWNPEVPLRLELLPAGFRFLDHWHVAAPLYDYNTLAFQHGTLEERTRTMALIGDLRVPLYETRALFLRQCPEVDALLEAWAYEREDGTDERLAFHRALWRVKPLILPLPITWIEGKQA